MKRRSGAFKGFLRGINNISGKRKGENKMNKIKFGKEVRNRVQTLNEYPQDMIVKLVNIGDDFQEITPPACGDRVYLFGVPSKKTDGTPYEGNSCEGEIKGAAEDGTYLICLDDGSETYVEGSDFEVQRDDFFPMWGFLWSFKYGFEERYINTPDGLQIMADCGFRIYGSDEWGTFFGIDGAGYDFYEAHRIPLYMKPYPERCEKAS